MLNIFNFELNAVHVFHGPINIEVCLLLTFEFSLNSITDSKVVLLGEFIFVLNIFCWNAARSVNGNSTIR